MSYPWIAQVLEDAEFSPGKGGTVKVQWYEAATAGSVNVVWNERVLVKKSRNHREVKDTDQISTNSVAAFNWVMIGAKKNKLPKNIATEARKVMEDAMLELKGNHISFFYFNASCITPRV